MENYPDLAKIACCLACVKFGLDYSIFFQVSRHMLAVIIIYTSPAGWECSKEAFNLALQSELAHIGSTAKKCSLLLYQISLSILIEHVEINSMEHR